MWSDGWDKLFSKQEWGKYPGEELIRFIARRFYSAPDRRAVRILEIGCGTGANLWFLAREGFTAVGLDGSAVGIGQAKDRFAKEGLPVELHVGDAMNLPFPDDSFDAVLDVECLCANSLKDTRRILDEARRVLKPGGWIYSKTFMTGMTGSETGKRLEGEPNTFLEMPDGPLAEECGLLRLVDEAEIPDIYGQFSPLEWDYVRRSDRNRAFSLSEWVIYGRKPE